MGGKGQPGQEMHHGIPLYHVAEMWEEKDEKGAREREEEKVGGPVMLFLDVLQLGYTVK